MEVESPSVAAMPTNISTTVEFGHNMREDLVLRHSPHHVIENLQMQDPGVKATGSRNPVSIIEAFPIGQHISEGLVFEIGRVDAA